MWRLKGDAGPPGEVSIGAEGVWGAGAEDIKDGCRNGSGEEGPGGRRRKGWAVREMHGEG